MTKKEKLEILKDLKKIINSNECDRYVQEVVSEIITKYQLKRTR